MAGPSVMGSLIGGATPWPALLGGLISSKTADITYVGTDGTSSTLTIPAFSAFLSALATRGEANLVATPNLLTLDNEEATMHVLSKEPTPGSIAFSQGVSTQQSVDYKEAGLEMKIKPQITEGDMIRLEIEQKLSGFTTPRFSTTLQAPAMKERKIKTTVVTENGQTVILAGLMDDETTKSKRKIPLLGDIPILGFLFSTTHTGTSKSNLLIFITPHIIKDRTDFSSILKRKITERNRFIDSNFSKSRRKQIRGAIKEHREDLLEFKSGSKAYIGEVTIESQQPVITTQPRGTTSRGSYVPVTPPVGTTTWQPIKPPAERYKKPVITPREYDLPKAPKTTMDSDMYKTQEKKEMKSSTWKTPEIKEEPKVKAPVIKEEPAKKEDVPWFQKMKKKQYKKPTIPTPAFEEEAPPPLPPSAAKTQPEVPRAYIKEVPEEEVPTVKRPAKKVEEPVKGDRWKKPAVGDSGEIDLAY